MIGQNTARKFSKAKVSGALDAVAESPPVLQLLAAMGLGAIAVALGVALAVILIGGKRT